MKKAILFVIVLLPMTCLARYGWSFSDYSLLAGPQFRAGHKPSLGFDLQYDHFSRSCTNHNGYRGFGITYSMSSQRRELGLRAMLNPTQLGVDVNRHLRFYPYLYAQGSFNQINQRNPITKEYHRTSYFSARPGLGIAGRYSKSKVISLRTMLQLSYDLPVNPAAAYKDTLVLELKIGFGLRSKRGIRNPEPTK